MAMLQALSILGAGPNAYPTVTLTGPCTLGPAGAPTGACGVGAGGIQRNARLPYAEQASLQIDHQFGKGLSLEAGYLFVAAHKLVRGNNININCPQGTAKPGNPYYAQGLLDPSGSLTPCQGTPTLGPFGLGPFFAYLNNPANPLLPYNPSGLEFGVPSSVAARAHAQRRPARLQQRRSQCRLSRTNSDRDGEGQVLPDDGQLHLFPHHRQRELHNLHQPAGQPVRLRGRTRQFQSGSPPPPGNELYGDHSERKLRAQLRTQQHHHTAIRTSLHAIRRPETYSATSPASAPTVSAARPWAAPVTQLLTAQPLSAETPTLVRPYTRGTYACRGISISAKSGCSISASMPSTSSIIQTSTK